MWKMGTICNDVAVQLLAPRELWWSQWSQVLYPGDSGVHLSGCLDVSNQGCVQCLHDVQFGVQCHEISSILQPWSTTMQEAAQRGDVARLPDGCVL